ncbi:MAG: exodeoxyribonuclease VII large subunit [Ruminococcaceae bacterium]|nr:exodeoxyribonuclease VII large subunit [Oscillospiraceae bacterium]
MSAELLTVTQLNEYLRMTMDANPFLANLSVRGEIANFTHHKSGHFYFSLKDETGTLRAVMFRSAAQYVNFRPENGMKVILTGRVSVFPRDGQYQIYVNLMQPDGLGALYLALEQLKRQLAAEGLFDEARKKPLPRAPQTIGLVTSPTGAAVRDMIDILGRRFPLARVVLYPALVQGRSAPESLVGGVRFFNDQLPVDVMIIGRGGGSAEDLWAFNDEALARTVAASRIPVISAVGHETDFTLCDLVADLRAPTPSAAAELAVPDKTELRQQLLGAAHTLEGAIEGKIAALRTAVKDLAAARPMQNPQNYVADKRMELSYLTQKQEAALDMLFLKQKNSFAALCGKMQTLSPLSVLARGYAAVFDGQGKAVCSVSGLSVGDRLHVRLRDGVAMATVTELAKGD